MPVTSCGRALRTTAGGDVLDLGPAWKSWPTLDRPAPTTAEALVSTAGAARAALLCLPPAGGSAQEFRAWGPLLPEGVRLLAAEYPGHGARRHVPPEHDMYDLIANLLPGVLQASLEHRVFFFGHSLGALVAYELVRAAEEAGARPALLFSAGCPGPEIVYSKHPNPRPETEALLATVRRQGGVPEWVLEQPEMVDALLAPLRADIFLIETFRPKPRRPVLCPVYGYFGSADSSATEASVRTWQSATQNFQGLREFVGGHFFTRQAFERVVEAVVVDLTKGLEPAGRT